MIRRIDIENFKSLRELRMNPKPLNLLMGLNSAGKSSLLQALLMIRQSYFKDASMSKLFINGDLEQLGRTNDIFYQNAASDESLSFCITDEDKDLELHFHYPRDSKDVFEREKTIRIFDGIDKISLFNNNFHYLNANHVSPEVAYKNINAEYSDINILGNYGENAPYYLARYGDKDNIVNEKLHHPNAKSPSLSHELDAWMREISPGVKIVAQEIQELSLTKMTVQVEVETGFSNEFSPKNVGFGIPYSLPLVLALLISKAGDLILIENPESHLHPRGQAELGKLISLSASSGVQIFCETHSDHIINGARVAVKKQMINSKDAGLFYFQKSKDNVLETQVESIAVDRNGELDKYPVGLLDEWGNLMGELF